MYVFFGFSSVQLGAVERLNFRRYPDLTSAYVRTAGDSGTTASHNVLLAPLSVPCWVAPGGALLKDTHTVISPGCRAHLRALTARC